MIESENIKQAAISQGLQFKEPSTGHAQIIGKSIVNWWYNSEKRTAHVSGESASQRMHKANQSQVFKRAKLIPKLKPVLGIKKTVRSQETEKLFHEGKAFCQRCAKSLRQRRACLVHHDKGYSVACNDCVDK